MFPPSPDGNGKALKDMFNLTGIVLPASPCGVPVKFQEELDSVGIPTTKDLNDEGHERLRLTKRFHPVPWNFFCFESVPRRVFVSI